MPDSLRASASVSGIRISQRLTSSVSTINDDVCTRGVRACIAGQIDVCTLELGRLSITAHGNHAVPEILDVFRDEVRETGVNVAWRDGVHTGKVAPFVGQRASQMDTAGFRDVVGGLALLLACTNLEDTNEWGLPVPGESLQCDRTWTQ